MNIQKELITPKRATELLALNANNRPLNRHHVLFLGQQMKEGKWMSAGDPIKISKSGRLLDGQHRLTALIESDATLTLFVITDLEDDTFQVMDTGRNRTAADMVSLSGQQNATTVAALVKMIIHYQSGLKTNSEGRARGRNGLNELTG